MMKYFAATFTDFIKFDRKPNEDFYLVSKKLPIFVIADGVTQSHFQEGKYKGEYAFPAASKAAAQIFCYTTSEFLEENLNLQKSHDREIFALIENALDLANQKIKELNITEGIDKRLDYLEHDWFDCVGIVGILAENKVFYGYVGDCGLAIFDGKNKLKFQTKDMVKPAIEEARKIYKNWDDLPKEKRSLIMHWDFRNRLDGKGYGSFTGEEGVKKYYKIGHQNLESKDLVVFYSDGFLNYFQFPKFIEILRLQPTRHPPVRRANGPLKTKKALDNFTFQKASQDYESYGTDRTLIAIEFENPAP